MLTIDKAYLCEDCYLFTIVTTINVFKIGKFVRK